MTYLGYDLSAVQGSNISFTQVAAQGISFIIAKNYQGNDGQDPTYIANVSTAKQAGLFAGSYNFIYPLPTSSAHPNRDPQDQARLHYSTCLTNDGFVATDCEWPTSDAWAQWGITAPFIVNWIVQYQEAYAALSGRPPCIYTYPNWMATLQAGGADVSPLAKYSLWAASYQTGSPTIPAPWNTLPSPQYIVWQTTGGGGKLPSGAPVDTNVCANLSIFGSTITPTTPPPPVVNPVPPPVPVPAPVVVQPAPTPAPTSSFWSDILGFLQKLFNF